MSPRPLDTRLLAAADARIQQSPDLGHAESLVVVHHGEVVFERYYRGRGPDDLADTHSVTKSFTSALVGILVQDGALELDAPVAPLLGSSGHEAAKDGITVRHLLTMTSGLCAEGLWELCEVALHGGPWVETIFAAPLESEPGSRFTYSNGAVHLLSAVIHHVAGESAAEVAAARLFEPLGIDRHEWPTDPQGHLYAAAHLMLTPRDLAKFGSLFLRGGRVDGAPVIDPGYAAAATSRQSAAGAPEEVGYGFLWWVDDLAWPRAYFAAGHGGQYIYVVPDLDLVVVTTADGYHPRPRGRLLRHLIEAYVVAAARPPRG